MSLDQRLQVREKEHEALLQRIQGVLKMDHRVVAAWLFGSRGRHTADVFSDLDLWVVVKDEAIEAITAARQSYVAQVEKPLLMLESPANAPLGGAYLMALYPGQAGVHQVDWYWQRQADASLSSHAVLLFERESIARDTRQEQLAPLGTPPPLTEQERAEKVTQIVTFFWAMSNIAVKSVLRRQVWTALNHLEGCRSLVDSITRLLGLNDVPEGQEAWRETLLPPVDRLAQIALLREMAQSVENLTKPIEKIGGRVPLAVIPSVYAFFDLAETVIQQEDRPNSPA